MRVPLKALYVKLTIDSIATTNFDIVLIDLFFKDKQISAADISALNTKANGGERLVITYMNLVLLNPTGIIGGKEGSFTNQDGLKKHTLGMRMKSG